MTKPWLLGEKTGTVVARHAVLMDRIESNADQGIRRFAISGVEAEIGIIVDLPILCRKRSASKNGDDSLRDHLSHPLTCQAKSQ